MHMYVNATHLNTSLWHLAQGKSKNALFMWATGKNPKKVHYPMLLECLYVLYFLQNVRKDI